MGYPKRVGPCVLLRFPAAPNLSFPRFFCGPLEMLSNFVKSFVKLLLYRMRRLEFACPRRQIPGQIPLDAPRESRRIAPLPSRPAVGVTMGLIRTLSDSN